MSNHVGVLKLPKKILENPELEAFWKDLNGKQIAYVQPIQVIVGKSELVVNVRVLGADYHIPKSWIKELSEAKKVCLKGYSKEDQEKLQTVFTYEELKAFDKQDKHISKGNKVKCQYNGKELEARLVLGRAVGVREYGSDGGFRLLNVTYYGFLVDIQCSPLSVTIL